MKFTITSETSTGGHKFRLASVAVHKADKVLSYAYGEYIWYMVMMQAGGAHCPCWLQQDKDPSSVHHAFVNVVIVGAHNMQSSTAHDLMFSCVILKHRLSRGSLPHGCLLLVCPCRPSL